MLGSGPARLEEGSRNIGREVWKQVTYSLGIFLVMRIENTKTNPLVQYSDREDSL